MANTRDLIGEQETLDALIGHTLTTFEDDAVKQLRISAFAGQNQLVDVFLPNLEKIGSSAFADCTGLKRARLGTNKTSVITTASNAMTKTGRGIIYVPDDLLDQYKNDSSWKPVASRIYGISSMPDPEWDEAEITDNWTQIIAKINNGTADYRIGSYKNLDCGTEGIKRCYVIGKDVDELADGSGMASFTFATNETLATSQAMNDTSYSNGVDGSGAAGGWEKSNMRKYLNETIITFLPSEIQTAVKSVKKYTRSFDVSGDIVANAVTTDKLWLFSYREVANNSSSVESTGPIYELYFSDKVRKNAFGNATPWWLRTGRDLYSYHLVGKSGNMQAASATATVLSGYTIGIVFGFCI